MPHQLKTGTPESIQDLLNGSLVLGPFAELPLGGRTLIFTTPAATVTFPGALGAMVSVKDAVAAINATGGLSGVASMRTHQNSGTQTLSTGKPAPMGMIVLQRDAGFEIDDPGTANPFLGLSASVPTISAGLVAASRILALSAGPVPGQLAVIISP